LEEVLAAHPSIAECAVVALPDELRGSVPLGIAVLKSGLGAAASSSSSSSTFSSSSSSADPESIESECVASVRARVGAVACFRRLLIVPRLPKTRSGKVLRNVLRALAAGEEHVATPATIEDASVIEEVRLSMRQQGIGAAAATANTKSK
jgi:propionyl-CoA synthetase